jgi:hypothetical protein
MATVTLVGPRRLNIGGVLYKRGYTVELDDHLAIAFEEDERFRVKGVRLTEEERRRAPPPKPTAQPSGPALTQAIRDAIDALDPDDDNAFDRGGKPSVRAISAVLGREVTAAERDRALTRGAAQPGHFDSADAPADGPQHHGLKLGKTRLTDEQRAELAKKAARINSAVPSGTDKVADREPEPALVAESDEPSMEVR